METLSNINFFRKEENKFLLSPWYWIKIILSTVLVIVFIISYFIYSMRDEAVYPMGFEWRKFVELPDNLTKQEVIDRIGWPLSVEIKENGLNSSILVSDENKERFLKLNEESTWWYSLDINAINNWCHTYIVFSEQGRIKEKKRFCLD